MKLKLNRKHLLKTTLFLLIIFLSSIAFAYSQSLDSEVEPIILSENEASLKKTAEEKISHMKIVKEGHLPFVVGNLKIEENWAVLNLRSYPEQMPKDTDIVFPDLYLAVAKYDKSLGWTVYIENESEYSNLLQQTPDTLVSQSVKKGFVSKYQAEQLAEGQEQLLLDSRTNDGRHVAGLPYQAGSSWRYSQGPTSAHASTVPNSAFDFLTPSGSSDTVRAAEDGIVLDAHETCIKIQRYNSDDEFLYQHISSSDISDWSVDDTVELGDALGSTTLSYGCGGNTTAHHVHFEYHHDDGVSGASFNGWVVSGVNLIKEGVTKVPSTSSPASVLHGDWIIALGSTKTAVFKGKAHLPKSLIIKNDSVLMLGNNDDVDSLIDIDRENEKLFVQSGSGIIVKDGAKLYLGDR